MNPIADSADPIRDSNGQLVRASEEHLRSVINNVPALIALVDALQRFAPKRRSQWLHGARDPGSSALCHCRPTD